MPVTVQARGGQLDLQSALLSVLSPAQGTGALWRPRYVSSLISLHPLLQLKSRQQDSQHKSAFR